MSTIRFFAVSFLRNFLDYYKVLIKVTWRIKNLEYREQIRQEPSIVILDKLNFYRKRNCASTELLEISIVLINELLDYLKMLHKCRRFLKTMCNVALNFIKIFKYCVTEIFKKPKRSK